MKEYSVDVAALSEQLGMPEFDINFYLECPYKDFVSGLFTKFDGNLPARFMHAAIGVMGEVNELIDAEDRKNLIEELGDLSFYLHAMMLDDKELANTAMKWQDRTEANDLRLIEAHDSLRRDANALLDIAKKHWVYEKALDIPLVARHIVDVASAMSGLCGMFDISQDEIERANRIKLLKRYKGTYTDAAAQARADKAEGE